MNLDDDYFFTDESIQVPYTPKPTSIQDASCQCDLISEKGDPEDQDGASIFETLPNEIQYKILSYLTPRELCFSVASVCKKWRQMAYEPILWQRLDFDSDVAPDVVVSILERTPLIRHLELRRYTDLWEMMPNIVNCTRLKSLDLRWCGGISVSIMSLLVTHCPLLEALNVEGCRTVDHSVVCQIIGWKKLKNLNLSHCTLLRNESVVLIATECRRLDKLNIDGLASISDGALLALIEQQKLSLKKLYLDGDELTDVTYQSLVECSKLKELSISFADLMSDIGLIAIKELKHLQYLKVKRGSELSEASLRSLFEGPNMRNLSCLDLSSCSNFDDVGVETMTKCCPSLKNLGLAWCWDISDRGLESIVGCCRGLEIIDLVGLVRITGACLVNIPLCLTKLVFLDLQQCSRIIDDILEDVVKQKPDLKILNYYGEEVETEKSSSRIITVLTRSVATECS